MAQDEIFMGFSSTGKKRVLITGVPGPASYVAATGFVVVAKTLRKVDRVLSWTEEVHTAVADRNQALDLSTITVNSIKFIVKVQVVTGAGGAATWAVVADAQDLSATILRVFVEGD